MYKSSFISKKFLQNLPLFILHYSIHHKVGRLFCVHFFDFEYKSLHLMIIICTYISQNRTDYLFLDCFKCIPLTFSDPFWICLEKAFRRFHIFILFTFTITNLTTHKMFHLFYLCFCTFNSYQIPL